MNYQSIQDFTMDQLLNYNEDYVGIIGNPGFSSDFIKNVFKPFAEGVEAEFGKDYFEHIGANKDMDDTVLSFYNGDYATGKRMDIKPIDLTTTAVKAWNGSKSMMADNRHDGDLRDLIHQAHEILG